MCQHSDTVLIARRTEFDGMDGGPEKALLTVAKHQWRTSEEYALEYDRRSRDSWNRNGTSGGGRSRAGEPHPYILDGRTGDIFFRRLRTRG